MSKKIEAAYMNYMRHYRGPAGSNVMVVYIAKTGAIGTVMDAENKDNNSLLLSVLYKGLSDLVPPKAMFHPEIVANASFRAQIEEFKPSGTGKCHVHYFMDVDAMPPYILEQALILIDTAFKRGGFEIVRSWFQTGDFDAFKQIARA
jgi:hypothetical protein